MRFVCKIFIALLPFLSACTMAMPTIAHPNDEKFLSVSDIHFTPFASCPTIAIRPCRLITALRQAPPQKWDALFKKYDHQAIAGYLHDTNYALLTSSLATVQAIGQHEKLQFTVILGDFLAHNFRGQYIYYSHDRTAAGYREFVKKTLQFLTMAIRDALPEGDIYPIVGNNDSYTDDYSVIADGEFLHDTAAIWVNFIKEPQNRKNLLAMFPIGGYYAVDVPLHKKQRILVLDTVLFSSSATGKQIAEAAQKQLTWLHEQLLTAAKQQQSVILAFHIPAGMNVYKTLMNLFSGIKQFWRPEYRMAFERELQHFPHTVRAILPGHVHIDNFPVAGLNSIANIPVIFTPSISPIFGNNPAVKVYRYDAKAFSIVDYDTYFYELHDQTKTPPWQQVGWAKESVTVK